MSSGAKDRKRGQAPDDFDRRLMPPLILGAILNPVNSSMLAVALVPIGAALGASPAHTAWLVSALYLTTAVGQPVVGRIVDAFGPRPVFLAGSMLVAAGGLLGALAPSLGVLVAARVIIGLGTCAGYPAAMYLIKSESQRTGKASPSGVLAALSVATQTISVIGPTIGGVLVSLGGWRSIFWVNAPLAAISLILGWRRLPRAHTPPDGASPRHPVALFKELDGVGMVLFALGLVGVMLYLMELDWPHVYVAGAGVVILAVFVWRELHVPSPFIDVRVLSEQWSLLATYLRQFLAATASYSIMYGYTQWLEAQRQLTPGQAGAMLLPMSITGIAVTALTGRRAQVWAKLLVGSTAMVAAALLLMTVHATSPLWYLAGIGVLFGIPQGAVSLANQNALYYQASADRIGSAAGLLRTFMYLGALASSVATATVYATAVTTPAVHQLAAVIAGCGALLLVATLVDRSLRRPRSARPATLASPDT